MLRCPLFPDTFTDSWRFSVAVLPSADALRPAPAVAALLTASGSEDPHRGPYQAGVATFRDTPENVGRQACGKHAAQYTGTQPDEGSVVTRRDTAAAENEVHSSGHTHRKSMRLKEMSAAKQAGERGKQRRASSLLRRRRGRAPRSKLRRRNQSYSPLTPPLLQLWEPFLMRTGAGLGRLAGRSC